MFSELWAHCRRERIPHIFVSLFVPKEIVQWRSHLANGLLPSKKLEKQCLDFQYIHQFPMSLCCFLTSMIHLFSCIVTAHLSRRKYLCNYIVWRHKIFSDFSQDKNALLLPLKTLTLCSYLSHNKTKIWSIWQYVTTHNVKEKWKFKSVYTVSSENKQKTKRKCQRNWDRDSL